MTVAGVVKEGEDIDRPAGWNPAPGILTIIGVNRFVFREIWGGQRIMPAL